MGAEPYYYFVEYQPDVLAALQELREREFAAGRYRPATERVQFPISPGSAAPGARHKSIDEAIQAAGEAGTGSILDLELLGDEPDFCTAGPLSEERLLELYGTTKPTREMVQLGTPLRLLVYGYKRKPIC